MVYQTVTDCTIENHSAIRKPKDVFNLVKSYKNAAQETLLLITLNTVRCPIGVYIISIGTINRTIVHPREVFYKAILDLSNDIILVHNHPSGDVDPSENDVDVTKRIYEVGKIVGINLLDHIIISDEKYYSFSTNSDILIRSDNSYKSKGEINYHEKNN
jgi:DNA repair protein RadC